MQQAHQQEHETDRPRQQHRQQTHQQEEQEQQQLEQQQQEQHQHEEQELQEGIEEAQWHEEDPAYGNNLSHNDPTSNKSNSNPLIQTLDEVRRHSKAEVFRLKQEILNMKGLNATLQDELNGLRTANDEHKQHAQVLREDNNRKSKLILQMKLVKASDSKALEQWQQEVTLHEEKSKRLTRNLHTKEQLIKDLKAKYDLLVVKHAELVAAQEVPTHRDIPLRSARAALSASNNNNNAVRTGGSKQPNATRVDEWELDPTSSTSTGVNKPPSDIADLPSTAADSYYDANPHLSAAELRNRLRASELDRVRTRNKIQEYKDKISEYEKTEQKMHEDVEKYKKQAASAEGLKTSVLKKESIIKANRVHLDKITRENDDLKIQMSEVVADTEKKIKYVMNM